MKGTVTIELDTFKQLESRVESLKKLKELYSKSTVVKRLIQSELISREDYRSRPEVMTDYNYVTKIQSEVKELMDFQYYLDK